MRNFELVIAGGGLTAVRAIKSYREADGGGRIALLAQEPNLPYHRPALSKRFLRGETTDAPFAEDASFYRDHEVEVLLETPVTSIDPGNRLVTTEDGPVHYDKLLIATGATPRRLRVPGADLDGVFSLRTLQDSERIRAAAGSAERAVVVGGGFIGMEVAASLRQLGLEVTLIHMGRGLFDLLGSPELSEQLLALYRDHGVDVMLEQEVAGFGGEDRLRIRRGQERRLRRPPTSLSSASASSRTPISSTGAASSPTTALSSTSASRRPLPASTPLGDVANFFDPLFGRQRRIEHWSNANYQGTEVGKILAGRGDGYDNVSSFFSEVFGVGVKVFGDVSHFDELTADGTLESGLLASYGEKGRLVGALTVGQSEDVEALAKDLISERAPTRALLDNLVGGGVAS